MFLSRERLGTMPTRRAPRPARLLIRSCVKAVFRLTYCSCSTFAASTCQNSVPSQPAHTSVAPPEPPHSTLNPKRRTNMLSFFCVFGGRVSGRQAEGLAGALELRPEGEVVLIDRCQLGGRWRELLVCQSGQDRFDALLAQDHVGAQHAQLRGPTFITTPPRHLLHQSLAPHFG